MLRVIKEVRPRWVIGENVAGLISIDNGMVFEDCCASLEAEGYAVQSFILPACAVNAPHRRDRVWIVAHSINGTDRTERREISKADEVQGINGEALGSGMFTGTSEYVGDAKRTGQQGGIVRPWEMQHGGTSAGSDWFEVATRLCRVDDGVSRGVDRVNRLKALGNAIVPQVVYEIFKAILEVELKAPANPADAVDRGVVFETGHSPTGQENKQRPATSKKEAQQ